MAFMYEVAQETPWSRPPVVLCTYFRSMADREGRQRSDSIWSH